MLAGGTGCGSCPCPHRVETHRSAGSENVTGGFLGRRLPHFLFLHLRRAAVTLQAAGASGNLRSSDGKTLGTPSPALWLPSTDGLRATTNRVRRKPQGNYSVKMVVAPI